jgi:glyoxylase-like metal-dependent hydrolase (beta-lactamase superfamily II)
VTNLSTRLLLAATVLSMGPALAQQDFSAVQIETTKVADDLYMLVGSGGNLSLSVGSDGAFLVDDQFAPLSDKILAAIAAVTDGSVKFLVNTHFHGDHTGGNENIGRTGAIIVAHENVRARMSTDQFRAIFDQAIPASPAAALPVVTFPEQINFHWNGTEIVAFHVPNAHTDGDSVIAYPQKNVIHMGDVFFNGAYPFVDVSSDGSLDGYISAVERVLALPFLNAQTKIIPGHGALATPADLRTFLGVLNTAKQRIQSAIDRGLSEDQAVAANLMAEYDASWGGGFMNPETFVRLSYQSLSR